MLETTEDGSREARASGLAEQAMPALILAFSERGTRPPEARWLTPSGIILGRGAQLFDGGPLADTKLSREHASLRSHGGQWLIEDLGSRNGTWVGGARITSPTTLAAGDTIRMGDSLLIFTLCPPPTQSGPPMPSLVGISTSMAAVRRAIDAVAKDTTTVLLVGETGTGKELVAQAVHERSGRRGPLVSLNCGAIAEGVLASELFGHVRGAFTGAAEARDGLFKAADGGTLFLDEVGETPLSLQVQLLRVLETRAVRPVGGTRDIPTDVRVVAATNRDLTAAVRAGAFRADLYARLSQWPITTPPLRDRRDDLPWLWVHLLRRRGTTRPMSVELAEALLAHSWPFNVRGLLNILTIADLASPEGPLSRSREVDLALAADRAIAARPAPPSPSSPPPDLPRHPAREPARGSNAVPPADELAAALTRSGGRVAEASRALGCSRQQLYRWLEARSIEIERFRK